MNLDERIDKDERAELIKEHSKYMNDLDWEGDDMEKGDAREDQEWDYSQNGKGWSLKYPDCLQPPQSPINLHS